MSQKTLLLLPLLGMFWLTVITAIWMLKLRYRAVLNDGVNPAYFKLNKGAKLPDYLMRVTQHFENLLEMPPLFYLSIILVISLGLVDTTYIALSWLYFLSRLFHTYVHTTYNHVPHRRNAFMVSSLILIVIWGKLTFDIVIIN